MAGSNFPLPSRQAGFTLIETLLAITLLSGVAIGLFYFFTNAMMHTSYNQGRTVAVNVARGVAAYMERLEFSALERYVRQSAGEQAPFVKLTSGDCENRAIFPEPDACRAQLGPTVNNIVYDGGRVAVFLIPYDGALWEQLVSSPPEAFPPPLRKQIEKEAEKVRASDPGLGQYLLKMYVVVRWGERPEEAEWIEGVIADETIR
ncbi:MULTISPECIES: prepilin-type N-terminal cleavage/methylation domain-containing protein [Geobacillus]|uniref:type IV pilus modification PilV family protein n=1 Tax=Geobacillus TaxID=129337 RepID=UPI0007AF9855|nr:MULTISPECIES: prepilin-type N-terminal cleavage/methylation domain-containing protein [Geobacillus]AOL35343.1 pilus assembly protein PilV [Geobacillus thermoleovorans]KZM58076.1 pilus assembly protein PilV [Geobacillus stearothermophilus]TRY39232.1 prepilin-type N-terminal cleavage/methylation domain-containing protein [Geobacillus sp. LEMMJ02]WMJ19259.1 prepilin-type N-terminal cleavage/methylation domain-containing protein [Geobacillus kaustophilus]